MNRKMPTYLVVCLSILWLMVACHNSSGGILPTQNSMEFREPTATSATAITTTATIEREMYLSLVELERDPLVTEPCSPPCWQNITPGVTSIQEAQKILFGESAPDKVCPDPELSVREPNVIFCEALFIVQAETEQRNVDYIFLWPTRQVTLAQAIERYGEPQKLYIGWTGLPDAPPNGVAISIPYPEHGLCLDFERDEEIYLVEPDLVVQRMIYYPVGGDDLECVSLGSMLEKQWKGYGDYYPYDDEDK